MKIFKSNIHHQKRVDKIAFEMNLDPGVIEETLGIMYKYIRGKFDEVDIDKDVPMTEEEFNKKFPTICIPSLGYFKPSYGKYVNIMKYKIKKYEKSKQAETKNGKEDSK